MGEPVNSWQAVVHSLMAGGLVVAGRIAFRLHRAPDYLSDICRRERVDPFAVCNEILKQADEDFKKGRIPLETYQHICIPIITLLLDGADWMAAYIAPGAEATMSGNKLCEQAGILCEDLGGTLKAFASVEDDRKYDEHDDVRIGECDIKIGLVISRLQAMRIELHRRRSAKVQL